MLATGTTFMPRRMVAFPCLNDVDYTQLMFVEAAKEAAAVAAGGNNLVSCTFT
jgi:hypothetical protein